MRGERVSLQNQPTDYSEHVHQSKYKGMTSDSTAGRNRESKLTVQESADQVQGGKKEHSVLDKDNRKGHRAPTHAKKLHSPRLLLH